MAFHRLSDGHIPVVHPEEELLSIDLAEDERQLLVSGLNQWGGPARCTEEMAWAMGFDSIKDLLDAADRLIDAVQRQRPMSRFDWTRALIAAEVCFSSVVVGAAWDWSIVTGVSDEDSLALLRRVQTKLINVVGPIIGHGFGTRRTGRRPIFWTPSPVDKATAASLAGVSTEQLDQWQQSGLRPAGPGVEPDPVRWWFGDVVRATVARHLASLGVTTAFMVRALNWAPLTALIEVRGDNAFRVNPGADLLPAAPVTVLDIAAFADELRQRWPTSSVTSWHPSP